MSATMGDVESDTMRLFLPSAKVCIFSALNEILTFKNVVYDITNHLGANTQRKVDQLQAKGEFGSLWLDED